MWREGECWVTLERMASALEVTAGRRAEAGEGAGEAGDGVQGEGGPRR